MSPSRGLVQTPTQPFHAEDNNTTDSTIISILERLLTGFDKKKLEMNRSVLRSEAMTWEYPNRVAVREYQLNICKKALLSNTLVCLPTGLGKTLIAAVVMHNFRRWYPSGSDYERICF